MTLGIQVLCTEGWANIAKTVHHIHDVAHGMGLAVRISLIEVTSQDQANELRFLGSPTVQIGGQDIEPAARPVSSYGFA